MQCFVPDILMLRGQHSVWYNDMRGNADKLLQTQNCDRILVVWSRFCEDSLAPAQDTGGHPTSPDYCLSDVKTQCSRPYIT